MNILEKWEAKLKKWLAPDWLDILTQAWSVRLMAAAFMLEVVGVVLETVGAFTSPVLSMLLRLVALALVFAAFAARFAYQQGLSKDG